MEKPDEDRLKVSKSKKKSIRQNRQERNSTTLVRLETQVEEQRKEAAARVEAEAKERAAEAERERMRAAGQFCCGQHACGSAWVVEVSGVRRGGQAAAAV